MTNMSRELKKRDGRLFHMSSSIIAVVKYRGLVGADKIEAARASKGAASKEQEAGDEDTSSDTHR